MLGMSVSEHYAYHADGKVPKTEKSPQMGDLCILFNILYIKLVQSFEFLSHCRVINKELQKPSAPSPPRPSLGTKAAAGLLACSPGASFPSPFPPSLRSRRFFLCPALGVTPGTAWTPTQTLAPSLGVFGRSRRSRATGGGRRLPWK